MISARNYSFDVIEDINRISFGFYSRKKLIGELVLIRCDDFFETHADIYEDLFFGCGFGIYMYSTVAEWCLARGYKLMSSEIERQSPDAIRLWGSKRLRDKFSISLEKNRWKIWNLQK